jgi:hypothetical protein
MDIPKAFDFAAKTLALLVLSVSLALGSWMLSGKFNAPTPGEIIVLGWFHWNDSSSGCCNLGWAGWAFLVDFLCSLFFLVAAYALVLRYRRKSASSS